MCVKAIPATSNITDRVTPPATTKTTRSSMKRMTARYKPSRMKIGIASSGAASAGFQVSKRSANADQKARSNKTKSVAKEIACLCLLGKEIKRWIIEPSLLRAQPWPSNSEISLRSPNSNSIIQMTRFVEPLFFRNYH